MKKIAAILLSFILIVSVPINVYAENENNNTDKNRLIQYGEDFIKMNVENSENSKWTNETIIDEIIETKDINNKFNGMIINLKTNDIPTGYLVIDAFDLNDIYISEFGYDDKYYITREEINLDISEKDIVYTGNRNFYTKKNEKICNIETGKTCSKSIIDKEYSQIITSNKLYNQDTGTKVVDNNTIQGINTMSGDSSLISSAIVPGGWGFEPAEMKDFSGYGNHCSPTAAINMLKYWSDKRGVTTIYSGNISNAFAHLRECMPGGDYEGVYEWDAYLGAREYLQKCSLHCEEGSDYYDKNISWYWIKKQITNGNALYISKNLSDYDGRNGYHAFLGIGYEEYSYGKYIRVCDGWDKSISHFIRFPGNDFRVAWYLRW